MRLRPSASIVQTRPLSVALAQNITEGIGAFANPSISAERGPAQVKSTKQVAGTRILVVEGFGALDIQFDWDPEPESGPLAQFRLNPNLAGVNLLHQVVNQIKPEASAVDLSIVFVVNPMELLEYLRQVILRNTQAVVFDSNEDRWSLVFSVDLDFPAVGRILDRVVKQVREYLIQLVFVADDRCRQLVFDV